MTHQNISEYENIDIISKNYTRSVQFLQWLDTSGKIMKFSRDEAQNKKWNNIIHGYIMDLANSASDDDARIYYTSLLYYLSNMTGLSPNEIDVILKQSQPKSAHGDEKVENIIVKKGIILSDESSVQVPIIREGMLNMKEYENDMNHKDIISLLLRYSMFGETSSGYFWSVPKDIYESIVLSRQKSINCLECFASPFNHVTGRFCSLFDEDMKLKYPEKVKCEGNFFTLIKKLTREKRKMNLLFNPPYTKVMIEKSLKALRLYLNAVPEAELFALLPNWSIVTKFLSARNDIEYMVLDSNSFWLYSFADSRLIHPGGFSVIIACKSPISAGIFERCRESMLLPITQ